MFLRGIIVEDDIQLMIAYNRVILLFVISYLRIGCNKNGTESESNDYVF